MVAVCPVNLETGPTIRRDRLSVQKGNTGLDYRLIIG